MLEFLIDNWGGLLIPTLALMIFIISIIKRIKEKKEQQSFPNIIGLLGKILGALVFRDLPHTIVGNPPTGHFQKPDFSYDDCEKTIIDDSIDKEDK